MTDWRHADPDDGRATDRGVALNDPMFVNWQMAALFSQLALNGCLPPLQPRFVQELIDLEVIERDSGSGQYKAVKELTEMLPPYTKLIQMLKEVSALYAGHRDVEASNLLRQLSDEIGYNLAYDWKRYLLRRAVDPSARPYQSIYNNEA
jgi:hypothetical protein